MAGAQHGGAEAFFLRLVSALFRAGVEERVVMRPNKDRFGGLNKLGLQPLELPFGGVGDLTTRQRLSKEIADFDPRIILAWMNRAVRYCPAGEHILVGRLGGYYKLKYYSHCDHLIANTMDIRNYLIRENWPKERITFLPNFADETPAPPVNRANFTTPDDVQLLLALGRLHENKAFDTLIDSLEFIPNAYLWIAGEGALQKDLSARAYHLGVADRVRWLGWQTNTASLLATADILVCPSRYEPLGNVILEAWAHNCPVIAAESKGPKWLIDSSGAGILVPIDDAQALAHSINQLIDSSETVVDLIAKGRLAYAQNFTEAVVVSKYIEFFNWISR